MKRVKLPTDAVQDVVINCIDTFRSEDLKKRMMSTIPSIKRETINYENYANIHQTYKILPFDMSVEFVSTDEMKKVYTEKFAKHSSVKSLYYDKFLASAKDGICPYCGQRVVSQIDHFLPKGEYPLLSVTPTNLVPSCNDCNKSKLASTADDKETEFLNPYFDDFDSFTWLSAEIVEQEKVLFQFKVVQPKDCDNVSFRRLKNHFNTLALNELYSIHAAQDFYNQVELYKSFFEIGGEELVREIIIKQYEGANRSDRNSWKSAMFKAILSSTWFFEVWISEEIKRSDIVDK